MTPPTASAKTAFFISARFINWIPNTAVAADAPFAPEDVSALRNASGKLEEFGKALVAAFERQAEVAD